MAAREAVTTASPTWTVVLNCRVGESLASDGPHIAFGLVVSGIVELFIDNFGGSIGSRECRCGCWILTTVLMALWPQLGAAAVVAVTECCIVDVARVRVTMRLGSGGVLGLWRYIEGLWDDRARGAILSRWRGGLRRVRCEGSYISKCGSR